MALRCKRQRWPLTCAAGPRGQPAVPRTVPGLLFGLMPQAAQALAAGGHVHRPLGVQPRGGPGQALGQRAAEGRGAWLPLPPLGGSGGPRSRFFPQEPGWRWSHQVLVLGERDELVQSHRLVPHGGHADTKLSIVLQRALAAAHGAQQRQAQPEPVPPR